MRFLYQLLLGQVCHFARYSNEPSFGQKGMQRRSPGAGCASGCLSNPRVLIALLMMGGALVSYYFGTHEYDNPITGRTQRLAIASPAQEVAMGLQSAPKLIAEFGGQVRDPKAQALVDEVGMKLVNASAARETEYQFDFHLLADNQTVNAFALPGGQIFITAKLYSLLENEDQLAGVLGHEIGHVVGRHSNQQMAKSGLIGGLANAAGILIGDGGAGGMQAAQMVANIVNMRYGREDELESDALGVRFMLDAGYNPEALIGVMRILKEASGGGGQPEILSTHPDPGNRAEFIKQEIAKYRTAGNSAAVRR
jgi:predicted Zn-dependent protease